MNQSDLLGPANEESGFRANVSRGAVYAFTAVAAASAAALPLKLVSDLAFGPSKYTLATTALITAAGVAGAFATGGFTTMIMTPLLFPKEKVDQMFASFSGATLAGVTLSYVFLCSAPGKSLRQWAATPPEPSAQIINLKEKTDDRRMTHAPDGRKIVFAKV